ncbi:carbohydrate ABC transporter permease [Murimonas intestini]|uniref:Carbohydrate ABC transporter membrane protein 2 (CUT1 family) n=1 Tax=Murimonas intestini TaxID=1337051 RepID=A0AB73SZD6_9FIRM|nr:carbohydrate ABC transporter permease [Murimonas intestini]MCR1842835.1 carbohydrate ABC transporter permease [Murimonas intestini]MCR1867826.1 carbohydrate ABC transporter permease [Murimonas intestini]MCR1885177.1 carbohydrate ABC transporter permease [Murimonas intestini]
MKKRQIKYLMGDIIGCLMTVLIFIIPFIFMLLTSLKDRKEANLLSLSLPSEIHLENYIQVFQENDYQILRAFKNSILLAGISVALLIVVCSMGGYFLQRRHDRLSGILNKLVMTGLMMPAAILPTIWVLQKLGIYKTMTGMILVEAALSIPFTVMLYIGYMSNIPTELEEAGFIDGCSPMRLFGKIIFPLLKPITATVIILDAVTIFNDFTNPLYFLPGRENVTVQLTIYNFMGKYQSSYNLLFADVILITVPMLILFLFFNKRIVDGMVAGAVKG